MTKSRHLIAPKHVWTAAEIATLRADYPHQITRTIALQLNVNVVVVYKKAMDLGLRKSAEFLATDRSGRILKGGKLSVATQFAPGQKSWNAGTHYTAGGRSAETRFKKGEMSGAAQRNWVPVGTYRINGDGILDRKITDLGRGPRDWEAVHRLVWKAAKGPIPPNHVVAFLPGKRTTELAQITLDALECISRRELVLRNSIWRKNPEIAQLYQLKGQITRRVNRMQKESNQHV